MINMQERMTAVLEQISTPLVWVTDLDRTVYRENMAVVVTHFIGEKRKRELDLLFQRGLLTNEEFLRECVERMFRRASPEAIAECCRQNAELMPFYLEFYRGLASFGVTTLAVTNNIDALARVVLQHLGLDIPVIGNGVQAGRFYPVHQDIALDKGIPVRWLCDHGHVVVGFAGDSIGDLEGARATRALGSTVLTIGEGHPKLDQVTDYKVDSYEGLLPLIAGFVARAQRSARLRVGRNVA